MSNIAGLGRFVLVDWLALREVFPFANDAAQGTRKALAAEFVIDGITPDSIKVALFEVDHPLDEVFTWHAVGLHVNSLMLVRATIIS